MSSIKRAVAAAGALALVLAGSFALATPVAAEVPANIDATRDGTSSITVHKHAQPSPVGQAGDGSELPAAPADPLAGVEFGLYRLTGVDLATTAGWDAAAAISAAVGAGAVPVPDADPATSVTIGAAGSFPVTLVATQETEADGATAFEDLPFGVYLVVEGDDNGGNEITSKAAPFVVSVPFATGTNTWLYDVHAYPKNSVTEISKSVTQPDPASAEFRNRDLVRWAVDLGVPNLTTGGSLTRFEIVDTIDAGELGFVATPPTGVSGNAVTVTNAAGTTLTVPDGSYTWSPEPASGTTLTLTFTPAGRTWLAANAQGGTVSASILTRLVAVGTDGLVQNSAAGHVNDGTVSTDATVEEGELQVLKYAETPDRIGLGGASFALFTTEAAALAGDPADRVLVNGVGEFGATADDGGLRISNLRTGQYWLVETIAPIGYVLDATPHAVTIVAGEADPDTAVNYLEIANEQVPPWELPLTGGDGATWFAVGGAGLVLLAVGAGILVARRRSAQV